MKKKYFIFLLITILTINISEAQTFNWNGSGNGTKEDPYQIGTIQQFDSLRYFIGYQHRHKHFILINDIDFSTYENWEPIGDARRQDGLMIGPFMGTLDGNNKIIKNLLVNRPEEDHIGLFAAVYSANLINIIIEDCRIIGQNFVGGLSAHLEKSTIRNCYLSGYLQGKSTVGGIGAIMYNNTTDKCTANVNIYGKDVVGGFAGSIGDKITNSYSSGIVRGESKVGGFAGEFNSSIAFGYSSADVQATEIAGGFTGFAIDGTNMHNCMALNNSVTGKFAVPFILIHRGTNTPFDIGFNFFLQEMLINGASITTDNASKQRGKMASKTVLQTASFYNNPDNWRTGFAAWDISTAEETTNTIWTIWENSSFPYFSTQSAPVVITETTETSIQGECKNTTEKIAIYKNEKLEKLITPVAQKWTLSFLNVLNSDDILSVIAYEKDKLPSYIVVSKLPIK
jgi:hypothetical protein